MRRLDSPTVVRRGLRRIGAAVAVVLLAPLWATGDAVADRVAPAGRVAPAERVVPAGGAPDVTVQLVGHGNGHGVGLSQWGAYGYAVDHGWTAAQILDHYYGGTVAGTADPITMTVRLNALDDRQTAVISDRGTLVVSGLAGGPWSSIVAREVAPSTYTVWARSDARVCPDAADTTLAGWTQIAGGISSVTIAPATDTSASADYADLLAVCEPAGTVRSYRGSIRAVNGTDGENRTVNHVPLEQYLRPIVASEMSAGWAPRGGGRGAHALQAQAVAARSYGLAEKRFSYAKTCDNTCQSYRGAAWRSGVTGAYVAVEQPATDAAVTATAGIVRRVGSATGPVATTMFSSSSGGRTAPTPLGFTVVEDLGDATALNPYHDWTATLSGAAISAAWPAIGTFTGLTVTERAGGGEWGGRVASIVVAGSRGTVKVPGATFRLALGLRSAWFTIVGTGTAAPAGSPASGNSGPATSNGCAAPAVAAAGAPAAAPSRLKAMAPVRLVDTRESGAVLGRECTLVVKPPVGAGATAVAINITTVGSQANGFVTAYPCGIERPLTATVQPLAGSAVGGAALVPLAADGTFCVFTNVATDVVIDLFGAFAPDAPGRFEPVAPQREFDSRPSGKRVAAGSMVHVDVTTGGAAAPDAVALTLHAIDAAADGFVTAWPCDAKQPFVSAVNVAAGASVTNHVEVAVATTGDFAGGVCLYVSAAMHLVVDMSGWYGAAGSTDLHPVSPFRVADTRAGQGWTGRFSRNVGRIITVAGSGAVPAASSVRALAAQITAVDATAPGYVTVHPCLPKAPELSMLRYPAARNVAVLVTGATDRSGRWCLVTNASTQLVIDVTGWFG